MAVANDHPVVVDGGWSSGDLKIQCSLLYCWHLKKIINSGVGFLQVGHKVAADDKMDLSWCGCKRFLQLSEPVAQTAFFLQQTQNVCRRVWRNSHAKAGMGKHDKEDTLWLKVWITNKCLPFQKKSKLKLWTALRDDIEHGKAWVTDLTFFSFHYCPT